MAIDRDEIAALTQEYGGQWGISHTRRLLRLISIIGEGLSYDSQAVWVAAHLHDWGGYSKWAQKDVDHAARSTEVAGDFYDAFVLPGGELVCLVGDVCGKGVGAALFMTLFRSLIRAAFTEDVLPPAGDRRGLNRAEHLQHVISSTSRYVEHTHEQANMFATVFAAVVDPRTGKVAYANCGNEPGLVASGKEALIELRPTGPVLGVIPGAKFGVGELTLQPGGLLMAFSDGIPDAINAGGDAFGNDRLRALLKDGPLPPAALLERLQASLADFVGSTEAFDDITVIGLQRKG